MQSTPEAAQGPALLSPSRRCEAEGHQAPGTAGTAVVRGTLAAARSDRPLRRSTPVGATRGARVTVGED